MAERASRKNAPAAQSRRALLDAGRELLRTRGVAPGLGRITLKEAIEISGVPRSTAYRLYQSDLGQLEAFRADLLADLDGGVDVGPTLEAVAKVLEAEQDRITSGDPIELAIACREVIREGVAANVNSVASDVEWHMYMSLMAAVGANAEIDTDLVELNRSAVANFGEGFLPLFEQLSAVFGLKPREPMSAEEFAALSVATIEGVALRQHFDPRLTSIKRNTGPDGSVQNWSAAAVAFEAHVLSWTEPDPAAATSADLSSWCAY